MKNIFVRKIFPYDPTVNGKYSRYEGYCKITLREEDPGIIFENELKTPENISIIFCSELKRAIESANAYYGNNLEIERLSELNEILFELPLLVGRRDFEKYGSIIVRERFFKLLIEDRLNEKQADIKSRIINTIDKLNKLPEGNYLLISHSFYMKLFELYLKYGNFNFFQNNDFENIINFENKLYEFGEGFDFRL
ncbi:histidine phosphatase family protein [Candidatus Woesebacteria bacterium]|nr:MAG: histidine phosphatase family protein [Candidatus Woesebacteria bacterium]